MSTPRIWTQSAEQKRANAAAARKRSKPAHRAISPETLAALGVSGMTKVVDHTVPRPVSEGRPKDTRAQPPIVEKPIVEGTEPKLSWGQRIGSYMTGVLKPSLRDVVYEFARKRIMHGG